MPEYKNAELLKENFSKKMKEFEELSVPVSEVYIAISQVIKDTPNANVDSVIRCINCDHCKREQDPSHGKTTYVCPVLGNEVFKDFYCYHGTPKVRKEIKPEPEPKPTPVPRVVKSPVDKPGNKLNSLNHILALCKKCKTDNRYWEIVNEMNQRGIYNVFLNRCDLCPYDNFGHCEFPDGRPATECCLPAIINELEAEIKKYKK